MKRKATRTPLRSRASRWLIKGEMDRIALRFRGLSDAGDTTFALIPMGFIEGLEGNGVNLDKFLGEMSSYCFEPRAPLPAAHPLKFRLRRVSPSIPDYDLISYDDTVQMHAASRSPPKQQDALWAVRKVGLLRRRLVGRDFNCLVTKTSWMDCQARSIVPPTFARTYADFQQKNPAHVSSGLLLEREEVGPSFGRFSWALYPLDSGGDYIICVFESEEEPRGVVFAHHGKKLLASRFKREDETDLPDPELLRWHFKQCFLKHFRITPAERKM